MAAVSQRRRCARLSLARPWACAWRAPSSWASAPPRAPRARWRRPLEHSCCVIAQLGQLSLRQGLHQDGSVLLLLDSNNSNSCPQAGAETARPAHRVCRRATAVPAFDRPWMARQPQHSCSWARRLRYEVHAPDAGFFFAGARFLAGAFLGAAFLAGAFLGLGGGLSS